MSAKKKECRHRLNLVDAGFANGRERGNPLGPAWEDGQAWKSPQWGTERSPWHRHFTDGAGADFTLR